MAVKLIELTSLDAKRFSKRGEKLGHIRIDNNSTVTMVHELNPEEMGLDFRFTVNYGGIGVIKIEGKMVYSGEARKMTKQWHDSQGKLPPKTASEIHTAIMRTCIPEAVALARDIQLPPPIPLPTINVTKDKPKAYGPEVA